eukprot:TRINITY_DN4969_c0_g1_i2.p1 TRINITY_DN4969_c0_g1~~TRINITY_DN4969_c0_g1_i2.p1  ORF type:complete len:104 (+),score=2.54 TRINITY_DN4969_c0_g1_i2:252-563(+)
MSQPEPQIRPPANEVPRQQFSIPSSLFLGQTQFHSVVLQQNNNLTYSFPSIQQRPQNLLPSFNNYVLPQLAAGHEPPLFGVVFPFVPMLVKRPYPMSGRGVPQ